MDIYIMAGVAGSGKSTYIKNNKSKNSLVLSSDEIRRELFDKLSQENNQLVFETMNKRLIAAIKENSFDEVYYDATNLSRKRRIGLYKNIKQLNKNANIIVLLFLLPLNIILKQNAQRTGDAVVPEHSIKRMYKDLQIPKLRVDCDNFKIATSYTIDDFKNEFEVGDTPHDSSYHKETVQEHIDLTIKNAEATNDMELVQVAKFHDLGKFVAKEFINDEQTIARFTGHENISSMYWLVNCKDNLDEENLRIAEAIFHHMNAHKGLSDKYIAKHKINDKELELINEFAKIDDLSRRV